MSVVAAPGVAPAPLRPEPGPARGRLLWAAAAAGLVGLVGGLLVAGTTARTGSVLVDAGQVTAWAAPVVDLARRLLAVLAVGSLLLPAVLLPSRGGRTGPAGDRALRGLPLVLLAWAAAELAGVVVLGSTLTATPLWRLDVSALAAAASFVPAQVGLVSATVLVAGAAVAAVARAGGTAGTGLSRCLLLPVVGAAVAPVVTGHGAGGDGHVLSTLALAVHVVAALVWVGGLIGLLRVHGWLVRPVVVYRRFGAVAVGAVVALAVSGPVAALEITGAVTVSGAVLLLASGYGALLLAKTAALAVLAAMGWLHRRVTLPALAVGSPGAFRRLAVVEVAVMVATIGVAVALAATPPPVTAAAGADGAVAAAPPTADEPAAAAPGSQGAEGPAGPTDEAVPGAGVDDDGEMRLDDMAGHDHGELSVGVLIDDERFHVGSVVRPGQRVTVYNISREEVTITADDGVFDVTVRGRTFATFEAPAAGDHPFTSRHDAGFADVLVVRDLS